MKPGKTATSIGFVGPSKASRRNHAFTLLELLIALAVLAVVSVAIFAQGGDTIRQLHDLEQQTLARWVAENEVAKLHLRRAHEPESEPLRAGTRRNLVTYGDKAWQVEEEIESAGHPALYRVEITVHAVEEGREVGPIDTLITFVGEY